MDSWLSPKVPQLRHEAPGPVRLGPDGLTPDGDVRLYVCGITPYDATHLGHAATYLTFDSLVRTLRAGGYEVTYVQNVTDIDDPLLERAAKIGVDWRELATSQIDLFRSDMTNLRVLAPDHYVGAVESVDLVVSAVARMSDTYGLPSGEDGADDVYAEVTADPRFGEVSGFSRDEMLEVFAERGGDPERAGKHDELDPLLWRGARQGEPSWDGKDLGEGRPGWHIECAAIGEHYLGGAPTIVGGGSDLVFPHHEMSAMHLRALGHEEPALYLHAGMIGYEGEKMSKSLGNLVLVSKLVDQGVDPRVVRLAMLDHHYADDHHWTDADLTRTTERLQAYQDAIAARAPGAAMTALVVHDCMTDDLDTPGALWALDAWAAGDAPRMTEGDETEELADLVTTVDSLLGICLIGGPFDTTCGCVESL